YAPVFRARSLADPALAAARTAIDLVLAGHEPFPAIAVDRHWRLVSANEAVELLLRGVDQALLQQPVNVLHLALHPMDWRRTPSISPNGGGTYWRGYAARSS